VLYYQARVGAPFGNDSEFTARGWPVWFSLATSHFLYDDDYTYRYPVRLSLGSQNIKGGSLQTIIINLEVPGEKQHHGTLQEDPSFERTQKTFQNSTHV
jgi:hypothetical protein